MIITLEDKGIEIIEKVYSHEEMNKILNLIESKELGNRFGIREFLTDKKETANFKNWRVKDGRTVVQPNKKLLENIFTIRIHLDDCTKENGALRVIEKSHKKGIIEMKNWTKSKNDVEKICEVQSGGIVIMKPLILHSSKRTENEQKRRVIHIEFTDQELPTGLHWNEKIEFNKSI